MATRYRKATPWRKRLLLLGAGAAALGAGILARQTAAGLKPFPTVLPPAATEVTRVRFTARDGTPLTRTYQNAWNVHDVVPYHRIPTLLRQAFLTAEDQRFFHHHGVDWTARLHALAQNLRARRAVRGASTISEQVARILHPRPRNVWSRWLEGFEAARLEERFSKTEILEFYLNQVPYARNRRGVAQAARAVFDRDLDTLSAAEMLALAVLVRSPSRLDLERGSEAIRKPLMQLAGRMHTQGLLDDAELAAARRDPLAVARPRLAVDAAHFVRFARSQVPDSPVGPATVTTTLDPGLQDRIQHILDRRLEGLSARNVRDGAVLVIDHVNDEILAWVNSGGPTAEGASDREGAQIDKVLTPRQPGSALKPFVYALALERGWTAATVIDDLPLAQAVGHGLHHYRNYSRSFYGPLRLRQTLANSLNIPAVRTVGFTGRAAALQRLRELGFDTLQAHPDFYGDGLALGTGEVSLYALARAYAALARGGELRPLRWTTSSLNAEDDLRPRVFDPEVSSIIADILSDPEARSLEFGRDSLLNLPVPTAVKTGTSNDYRDAWTAGFSHRYTVAAWMGNLDREPMHEITGSLGPALVLRAVFAELHRHGDSEPLYLSRKLRQQTICRASGRLPRAACPTTNEWFRQGKAPIEHCHLHGRRRTSNGARSDEAAAPPPVTAQDLRMASPTPGLHLAMDPRIPDDLEVFALRLEGASGISKVEWIVDGKIVATTSGKASYPWPLARGRHQARARAWIGNGERPIETEQVGFLVK